MQVYILLRNELEPPSTRPNLIAYKQPAQNVIKFDVFWPWLHLTVHPAINANPHPPSPAGGGVMMARLHASLGRRERLDSAHRGLAQSQHGHQQRVQAPAACPPRSPTAAAAVPLSRTLRAFGDGE